MKLAKVLGIVGRALLASGVLILLFVVYQLWGTGIYEARAQDKLADDFDDALADAGVDPATAEQAGTLDGQRGEVAPLSPPDDGEGVARLVIPEIGVDKVIVEGVSVADLKRGPGHFPDTPLPGQQGNASIAGHRTTYGAPFNRLDHLEVGDEILVTTLQGAFRYTVEQPEGGGEPYQIVSPDQVEVLDDHGDDRLTLIACHPEYSAAQRIVIVAELEGRAVQESGPRPAGGSDEVDGSPRRTYVELDAPGLSGRRASAWPTILFGLTGALVVVAAWLATRVVRRWVAYGVGTPVFLVALFFFYEEFSRLLPANF